MSKSIHTALYYPHLSFGDTSWAKSMALFYDRVYRIVPPAVTPTDPPELAVLIEAGALGVPIDPKPYAKAAAESFVAHLDAGWDAAELKDARTARRELTPIHSGKIDRVLRDMFSDMGFDRHADWIAVPSDIAHDYMLYLATEIGSKSNIGLVTGSVAPWVVAEYMLHDGKLADHFPEDPQPEAEPLVLFSTLLKNFIPTNIHEISASDILRFRQKRVDELQQLREEIGALATALEGIEDPDVARDVCIRQVNRVERALADFRSAADVLKAKSWFGIQMMGIPGVMGVASALGITGPASVVLIGTSVLLGGIYALKSTPVELKALRKKSPFSTLAVMQDELKVHDLALHARARMHEFIND